MTWKRISLPDIRDIMSAFEVSLVRKVYGTNGLHTVQIVRDTNSQWFEKSRYRRGVTVSRNRAIQMDIY